MTEEEAMLAAQEDEKKQKKAKDPDVVPFMDNPKKVRNIRSITLLILLLLAPAIYTVVTDDFDFEGLLNYEFGGLIIFMTLSNLLLVFEIRTRAFEDECFFDPTINQMEESIKVNGKRIKENTPLALKGLGKHNRMLQKAQDEEKTTNKLEKAESKLSNLQIKQSYAIMFKKRIARKVLKLEQKIAKLKSNNLHKWWFKPYKLKNVITHNASNKSKPIGNKQLKVKHPKKVPVVKSLIKMPTKGFTMALGGFLAPVFFIEDKKALFKFYLWFIGIMILTSVSQYILTRYKTRTSYKSDLETILSVQQVVLDYIDNPDAEDSKDKIDITKMFVGDQTVKLLESVKKHFTIEQLHNMYPGVDKFEFVKDTKKILATINPEPKHDHPILNHLKGNKNE